MAKKKQESEEPKKISGKLPPRAEIDKFLKNAGRVTANMEEARGQLGEYTSNFVNDWNLEKKAITTFRQFMKMDHAKACTVLQQFMYLIENSELAGAMDGDLLSAMEDEEEQERAPTEEEIVAKNEALLKSGIKPLDGEAEGTYSVN